jgi:hypothetical protein
MPDNKKIRRPLDNKRIDIHDPKEINNWCKSFGCTKKQLINAVNAVGTSANKVKKYLK